MHLAKTWECGKSSHVQERDNRIKIGWNEDWFTAFENRFKIYDVIKSKRVSNSSNIIQKVEKSSLSHTKWEYATGNAFLPVTLYKFLWSFVLIPVIFECKRNDFSLFYTSFMAFVVCRIVVQLVCNYDYLYFWSFPYWDSQSTQNIFKTF